MAMAELLALLDAVDSEPPPASNRPRRAAAPKNLAYSALEPLAFHHILEMSKIGTAKKRTASDSDDEKLARISGGTKERAKRPRGDLSALEEAASATLSGAGQKASNSPAKTESARKARSRHQERPKSAVTPSPAPSSPTPKKVAKGSLPSGSRAAAARADEGMNHLVTYLESVGIAGALVRGWKVEEKARPPSPGSNPTAKMHVDRYFYDPSGA